MSETPRSLLETYLAAAEVKLTLAQNEVAAFTALLATVPDVQPEVPASVDEEGVKGKKKKEKKFDADGKEIKKAISAYTMFMKEHGSKADGLNNYGFVGATEKWKELTVNQKSGYETKAEEFNLEDGRAVSKATLKRSAGTNAAPSPSKKVATPSKAVGSSNVGTGDDSSSEEETSVTETAKKRKKEKKEKKSKKDKKKRRESVGSEVSSD